ncbi:nuclear pore complex protein Nup160 homolog [Leguminivora glycinivorella]|uniref:nuclear pore complex protein Nup160 homolog n=1 Tax=Leguminivora glycinivorella TaxID=1035111 RepID=UPI00200FB085|nr:nuclear pore complex protein Nup160 homolog [Leguminivora glycinivorella]
MNNPRQFILGLSLLDLSDAEGAYTAFCKAAKGVSTEPFLRQLVAAPDARLTQHQALVLYYMKVIKLFEIHDAGACVVRLAETAISIADKNDPNLPMFQWVVFKWHLAGGRVERALSAAAANPAPHARAAAAATLLTTLASRKQLSALVSCGALAAEAERAAAARAKLHDAHGDNPYYDFLYALHISRHHYRKGQLSLWCMFSSASISKATKRASILRRASGGSGARAKLHDAHGDNPYYDFLYALHISRHHYRKAASIMYERAARCAAERAEAADGQRARWLAAALTCLRLAKPEHAFLARPAPRALQVIGPDELAAELREEVPDSLDPVQQALLGGENIDFDGLYPHLKDANAETLLSVTKRALSTDQFLPRWFLQAYMDRDGAGCVRALLGGGRALEAARACLGVLRAALLGLDAHAPPRAAPLAAVDALRAELQPHARQNPHSEYAEMYDELNDLVKEYTDTLVRTSEDMKLAHLNYSTVN